MKAVKEAWRRLATADAISIPAVLVVSFQVYIGSLTAPFVDLTGRFGEFLLVRLGAVFAMVFVLFAGWLLLRSLPATRRHPLVTLAIFVSASVALSTMMNYLLIVTGFTDEWTLGRRLAVALPGALAITVAAAILITYSRELSRTNAELAGRVSDLEQLKAQTALRIQRRKDSLITSVRRQLEEALSKITSSPGGATPDRLSGLVEDLIRPLSYRLAQQIRTVDPPRDVYGHTRVSWARVFRGALETNPIHPWPTTIWQGSLLGMFLVPGFGLPGLLGTLIVLATTLLVTTTAKTFWSVVPGRAPLIARGVFLTVTAALMAVAPLPWVSTVSDYDFLLPHVLFGWLTLTVFITWVLALVNSLTKGLEQSHQRLIETRNELQREVVHLNNELRLVQRNVSRALHGPIAQAITSAVVRLNARSGAWNPASSVQDIQLHLAQALEKLGSPTAVPPALQEAVAELREVWDEVVDICSSIDPTALALLEADSVGRSALIELIREGCSNAIRHGNARRISIDIAPLPSGQEVTLTIENDGQPPPPKAVRGMGSEMFDEMSIRWSRSHEDGRVIVQAVVPVSAKA